MDRIIVGYDGSEPARRALQQACELAVRLQCPLLVLTAAADRLDLRHEAKARALDPEPGRRVAEEGARYAREQGVAEVEVHTSLEAPDDALVLLAAEGCSLLVVGHRGHGGIRERLLGSVAKSVVDRAPCSVLVVR
jgi:nucleotide-binding universal stress UspA family protein